MDPLDDTLAACWVGPKDHKHREFLFQSSSPFWTNQPDPLDPDYCVPNEEITEKITSQEKWRLHHELKWKGSTFAHVCQCGTAHPTGDPHPFCPFPFCPHPQCLRNQLVDLGWTTGILWCRNTPAYGHQVNRNAEPPVEFGTVANLRRRMPRQGRCLC